MANEGQVGRTLDGLATAAQAASKPGRGLPPVHLWNPPFCGDLDMRIASDGTWFYNGTPIGRPALVRLFSTILKKEGGKHFLVTPVEKVGIVVEDAPFVAVEMQPAAGILKFRTNVEDWITCDAEHALRFEPGAEDGLVPYLHVRADLWAKVTRSIYYDLVELGEERQVDGAPKFGVASGDIFFPMADAAVVRTAR